MKSDWAAALPPSRSTGDAPTGGVAGDMNLVRAALVEIRANVPNPTQDVLSGTYHVANHNVKGDWTGGVTGSGTNDTAALQALINTVPEKSTIQFSADKTYRLDNLLITKTLTFDGNGASIVTSPLPGNAPLFWFRGSIGSLVNINSATEGATTVTCTTAADAGGFAVGDYVIVRDLPTLLKFDGAASGHTDGRSEINRVLSVDAGTGVVTLESGLEWSYSSSPRIYRVTSMLDRPVVRGFASIVEVDAGVWSGVLHEGVPHLVHFTYCAAPRVEDIGASRWNMHVVNFYRCLRPQAERIAARDPLRPANGGHGYLARFDECRGGVVRNSVSHGARHTVNWVNSYDCVSQDNVAFNSVTAAYQTHGIFSKRAVSSGDASHGGVNGWSFGNPQFRDDSDMLIERPHCISAGTAIVARSRSQRLTVRDPDLHIAGTSRGVHVCEGAGRVAITGGTLEQFDTGNQVLVRSRLGNGDTLVASPGDVTIVGTRMVGGTQTLLLDAVGEIEVRDVLFDSPTMGSTGAALIGIGTSEGLTPSGVRVSGCRASGAYQNAVQLGTVPTGRYDLEALHFPGGAVTAPAAANLRMVRVRAATLTLSGDAPAAAAAGAKIAQNSPATYDIVNQENRDYTASQSNIPTPAGIKGAFVYLIAGGGGGGSGRRGAAGTVRCGGGGGGTGVIQEFFVPAAHWGTTYSVTIGAGGTGGVAKTTDDTNGSAGGSGGVTSISTGSLTLRTATPGGGGAGTATNGLGGSAANSQSASGGTASATGGAGATGNNSAGPAPTGGGSGGGITTGDVAGAGGPGGGLSYLISAAAPTGGVVGGAAPANGIALGAGLPGSGGGGGAASITGPAQAGANGAQHGGAGGGGGASLNGNNSGAGGDGAPGFARVRFVW